MKLEISRRRKFKRDALNIFLKIAEDNLDAAKRFLRSLDSDLHNLSRMPGMGAQREYTSSQLHGIRSWPVSGFNNYLIFYRFDDREIIGVRVIHGARDLEKALLE